MVVSVLVFVCVVRICISTSTSIFLLVIPILIVVVVVVAAAVAVHHLGSGPTELERLSLSWRPRESRGQRRRHLGQMCLPAGPPRLLQNIWVNYGELTRRHLLILIANSWEYPNTGLHSGFQIIVICPGKCWHCDDC